MSEREVEEVEKKGVSQKELKEMLGRMKMDLYKELEPVADFTQVINMINEVMVSPDYFEDSAAADYFYDDFICIITKFLLRNNEYKTPEVIYCIYNSGLVYFRAIYIYSL